MSYSQIAESIIAKNAIQNEIKEVEDLLKKVNREISSKRIIIKESLPTYSLQDVRYCENRMRELIPKKKELEDKLNRLNDSFSNINY